MGDQAGSTRFRALFELAMRAYETMMGITLAEHPLAVRLRSCHSIQSITALVQDQASAFSEYRGRNNIMKSIKRIIAILTTLSGTTSFPGAAGLSFAISAGLVMLLAVAKDKSKSANYDALVDLFEVIEHILRPLNMYCRIRSPPVLDEMMIKILTMLLSTLVLVTKELKQGRLLQSVKKLFGEKDIAAILERLDKITRDEAQTSAAEILRIIYSLIQNINAVMSNGKPSVDGLRTALPLHKKNKAKL